MCQFMMEYTFYDYCIWYNTQLTVYRDYHRQYTLSVYIIYAVNILLPAPCKCVNSWWNIHSMTTAYHWEPNLPRSGHKKVPRLTGPVGAPFYTPIGAPFCAPIGAPLYAPIGAPFCDPGAPFYAPFGAPFCDPGAPLYAPCGASGCTSVGAPFCAPSGAHFCPPSGAHFCAPNGSLERGSAPIGARYSAPIENRKLWKH